MMTDTTRPRVPLARRRLLGGGATALAAAALPLAEGRAAGFPERPVRLLVGFTPGGQTDIFARGLAERLGAELGQPVVIENRPGAGSSVAVSEVARARPDGHTLMFINPSGFAIHPQVAARPSYDPLKDLAPVAMVANTPVTVVAGPGFTGGDVRELIAQARANPGGLTYGSAGAGTVTQLGMELFLQKAGGLQLVHVPYRGAALVAQDLLAGRIPLMVDAFATMVEQHRSGTVRMLCVLAQERAAAAPDVPTAIESGVPDAIADVYNAVVAPAATPAPAIETLNAAIRRVTASDSYRAFLANYGAAAGGPMTAAEVTTYLHNDFRRWTPVIRATGLRIE